MEIAIRGGRILTPDEELIDCQLSINSGLIDSIGPVPDAQDKSQFEKVIKADGLWITPGLIDIHTHGATGADTMDATPKALRSFGRFLVQHGVTSYLPTTITASNAHIQAAIENVNEFEDPEGARILGVHLEGPYLNAARKGAQPTKHLRIAEKREYLPWLQHDKVKLITVAPEIDGVLDLISAGQENGVGFAVGHSEADFETMQTAADLGLSQATHTFNGMPQLHHRRPGTVGSVLTDERIFAQIIADGVHLHPAIVKLIVKAKSIDKTILISDSMRATGLEDGEYDLGGQSVFVKDGVANLMEGDQVGSLAGSTLTLDQAIRNTIVFTGLPFQEVIKMATVVPARAIGASDNVGVIKQGARADLVLFDEALEIKMVMVNGNIVYQSV